MASEIHSMSDMPWLRKTMSMRGISEIPTRIFKFLSPQSEFFKDSVESSLLRSEVFLSSRKTFNDPFDTSCALEISDLPKAVDAWIRKFCERNPEYSHDSYGQNFRDNPQDWLERATLSIEKSFDEFGIHSFADTGSNPLMWAHYADKHRGIALMYKHGIEGVQFGAFPVRYQDEFPISDWDENDGLDIMQAFVKGNAWKYEGEWRLVRPSAAGRKEKLPDNALCGVVFGINVQPEHGQYILDIIAQRVSLGLPGLRMFRAKKEKSFSLSFERLGDNGWEKVPYPLALR